MATILNIPEQIRHVRRYGEIAAVLAKYGFGDIVQEIGLDRLIERGLSRVGQSARAPEFEQLKREERVRRALEDLGPTFVKMGQVLSTRADLIPPEWAEEFRKLQNDVPRVPFEEIRARLEDEFSDDLYDTLFKKIDPTPLAAGSMAQVHRAEMRDGRHVVLKILRPGIEEVITSDMEVLKTLAGWAESRFKAMGYSPVEVVKEFTKELKRELDMTLEGASTERFRAQFEDDDGITFPAVHWDATTKGVLTLDEVHGVSLSGIDPASLSDHDRRAIVENGARAVLRQCLEFGFFHADPHPGNIFALAGGQVCFIDCGMTGHIDEKTQQQLADLVAGVVTTDADRVIAVVGVLCDADPSKLEERSFRSDVREFISNFKDTPLERLNMGRLLQEFFDKLRVHHIRCPADLVLLIKALATIEAVGAALDPKFDMVGYARPYVERLVSRKYGLGAVRKRLEAGLLRYAELAEDLPGDVRFLITQVKRNRLAINLEHKGLSRLTQTIEHASRNISFALIIAAMLVGSAILVLADRNSSVGVLTALGVAGFLAAAVLVVLIVITNRRLRDRE